MQTGDGTAGPGEPDGGLRGRVAGWVTVLWPPAALLVLLVVSWHVLVVLTGWPALILPKPGDVLAKMVEERDVFLRNGITTLGAIFAGFGLAVAVALPLAVLMVYNKTLHRAVYPLLVLSQVVPKVAVAPLFIIWFGFGLIPKVLMVMLIAFFPLVINAMVGFMQARPQALMLVRSMGASRWQAFWKIRWPWALPSIFAGAKVGITLAVVGAVVAEFVGSDQGLGVLLIVARGNFDGTMAFAAVGWLSGIGLLLFLSVAALERVTVHGTADKRSFEASGGL